MAAGYVVLVLEVGSTFTTTLTMTNTDGSLFDFSNYSGVCKMRKSYISTTDVYDIVVSMHDDPTDGVIILSMDATSTEVVDPGRYVFDVCITNGSVTTRILEGIIEVRACATLNSIDVGATGF